MSTSASPRPSGGTKGATTSRPVRRSSTRDAQEDLVRAVPKAKVRRARLQLSRIDPWSVLKLAFLLSVALGVLMGGLVWLRLDGAGSLLGWSTIALSTVVFAAFFMASLRSACAQREAARSSAVSAPRLHGLRAR